MEMSLRPPLMKLSASLRFDSGNTTSALVAYQSTNGFWFAYNWILIGMAASIPLALAARESSQHVRGVRDAAGPPGFGPRTRKGEGSGADRRETFPEWMGKVVDD